MTVEVCFSPVEATGLSSSSKRNRGDEGWLSAYDYDYLGGRWIARDASTEPPFASVIALPLVDWAPTFNAVDEVVGLKLDFDGQQLTLRTWEGEVTT